MTQALDVVILADHSALLAIPAFLPAILVVGIVIWVAKRDRRAAAEEHDAAHSEDAASSDEDGRP